MSDPLLFALGFFVSLLCAGFVFASGAEMKRLADEQQQREREAE